MVRLAEQRGNGCLATLKFNKLLGKIKEVYLVTTLENRINAEILRFEENEIQVEMGAFKLVSVEIVFA